jgi:hypothetical protein
VKIRHAAVVSMLAAGSTALAEEPAATNEELAKASQNPVADIVSIPFQNNTNFGYGPSNDQTQNVLNVQPVVPLRITSGWNVITRTIVPLVWQPSFTDGDTTFGLGDINFSAFLSPAKPGAVIWGIGPVASFPTATSPAVGSESTWGLGPSAVALAITGPWVVGALANNVWSVAGDKSNTFLLQYFVNYNFGKTGWYLTSVPIITADWEAPSGQQWIVPFGGGFGKIVRVGGKLPVNLSASAYANVVKPDIGPEWTLRLQASILLPAAMFR